MADWTHFRYGLSQHQFGEFWAPPAGRDRGCLVYFQGGGWSRPTTDRIRDSRVGLPVFAQGIEPNEYVVGEQMVAVSALLASATYDSPLLAGNDHSPPDWESGAKYGVGGELPPVYVTHGGAIYRCYDTHVAAAESEPGVGPKWERVWERPAANDIGASHGLAVAQQAGFSRGASRPGYLASGIDDVLLLVKFLKQNARALGIDPERIVLHGDSAAGQAVGAAAYSLGSAHVPTVHHRDPVARHLAGGRRGVATADSGVAGVILEITPDDWRHYPSHAIHTENLFGLGGLEQVAEFEALPDEQKAALSPLGMLRATGNARPTLLHYPLDDPGDDVGDEEPPWKSAKYHHADNGEQIRRELEACGQEEVVFWHASNAPAEIGAAMHAWLRELWGYPNIGGVDA